MKFFKKKSSKLLCNFYSKNDVFVFPTTGSYGIVIDEAISFNMPVICSDQVGELKNRVIHEINGKIFNCGSKKLVNSIVILQNPKILTIQSKNCKNKIPKIIILNM